MLCVPRRFGFTQCGHVRVERFTEPFGADLLVGLREIERKSIVGLAGEMRGADVVVQFQAFEQLRPLHLLGFSKLGQWAEEPDKSPASAEVDLKPTSEIRSRNRASEGFCSIA